MSTAALPVQPPSPAAGYPWIVRPSVDLLIGCGGWSAPLLFISYLLVEGEARQWAGWFYGLALLCNYPHYMATIHRAYASSADRARYRLFTHYVTAVLAALAVAAHVETALLVWLFTAYVMWSPWHYTGQNFGIAMMFLRRAGVEVTAPERQRLHAGFVAAYLMLLASFNDGVSRDPLVASLALPGAAARAIEVAGGLVFAGAGLSVFVPLARRTRWQALAAPATLYSTQAFWFVVPIVLSWAMPLAVPQTRYSSGILAVMHSAQYLWVTRYYARRDAMRAGRADSSWSSLAYWSTLVIGGMALFLPGPWLASYGGHFDFTYSMLTVTAVVNIHHFVLDGVVWKLRDPRVAAALVDSSDRTGGGATAPSPAPAAARPPWARLAIRAVPAACLLALAAVDQWRYGLVLRDADRAALQQARLLNPFDSAVHVRLANAAGRSGDLAAAERDLRAAVAANPGDPIAAHRLARLLIESGRLADADRHLQAMLERWPRDVDSRVNAGIIAQRLNRHGDAERHWRRALELAPTLPRVDLYLAELLDGQGRPAEALPYYRRALERIARDGRDERPDPRHVAMIVVKFGDALASSGDDSLAASQYELAARIARTAGLAEIEALVSQRRAGSR